MAAQERNRKRERNATTELVTQWRDDAKGVDVDTLTIEDVLAMTTATYGALALVAFYGARRGRLAIGAGKRDTVTLPAPDALEDTDTALDAIEALFSECAKGGARVKTVGGFAYNAGRARGKRRAVHRIREQGSLLVEPATDHKAPVTVVWTTRDADGVGVDHELASFADLMEACPPKNRKRLNEAASRWRTKDDPHDHAVRDMRRALGVTARPGAPTLSIA